ncbi:MAG TPA: divalent-cation tolerance protein CutA [Chitinispirillaceae bacterium]|nr:divalent-cation tolerance protein CutA [Chitinispirillaceae bacterium]
MKLIIVYITTSDLDEARLIGKNIIKERLAACVNIFDGMHSMYWWEGTINETSEAVIIAKTDQDLLPSLIERVKSLHSYDCPCIVSIPVNGGNESYLKWLQSEVNTEPDQNEQ